MLDIIAIILPLFILIGVGFGCVRTGFLRKQDVRVFGAFVLHLALPVLVFLALSGSRFSDILNLDYVGVYGLGSIACFMIALLFARLVRRQPLEGSAMLALGSATSNSGFIGYPLALLVVGAPTAAIVMALNIFIENAFIIPLALALGAAGQAGKVAFGRLVVDTVKRLARSPLIIAIVLGAGSSYFGLTLPGPVLDAANRLADAAGALSLIYVGGTLASLEVRRLGADVGQGVIGKLFLHPMVVLIGIWLWPGLPADYATAALLFAAVPMFAVFPIFGAQFGRQDMCAAILFVTVIVSFFTLTGVLWLVTQHPGWLGLS
ncbi:AEC family transporter [Cucumibacter marinus]|uniref:AEC family transporter n=1 Tax=Cucumibacter marinus TaxID=1121252 RepID=UPI000417C3CA|nr:AEC family transporter [Cucumibacter marinus]